MAHIVIVEGERFTCMRLCKLLVPCRGFILSLFKQAITELPLHCRELQQVLIFLIGEALYQRFKVNDGTFEFVECKQILGGVLIGCIIKM